MCTSFSTRIYKDALPIFRDKFGNLHSSLGIALHNIALLLMAKGLMVKALEAEDESFRILHYVYKGDHKYTQAAAARLQYFEQRMLILLV